MMDELGQGDQSYGEAHVVQPEKKSSGLGVSAYYTYLVQAKLVEENWSSRKRYSDFEWLRSALAKCFPGVRIPPLPKKQGAAENLLAKTGRVDDTFIESRRVGLEDFLQRCFQRKELCIDSKLLKGFLGTADEQEMDEFRGKIDKISVSGRCQKYSQIYEDLKDAELPDEDRISPFRTFLEDQTKQLRELADGYKQVVDAQQAVTTALSSAHLKLAAISHSESGNLATAGFAKHERKDLVEGLSQQNKLMQASPSMNYDVLFEAAERELLEAEAMQEAVDSIDHLQQELDAARARAEHLGQSLKNVMDGGEIPSTGTGVARMLGMAKPKDREQKIAEMKAEHEQKQKDVTAFEEFHRLAQKVLVCREIKSFYNEKVEGHRKAKAAFAGLSQRTAEDFCKIWGGLVLEKTVIHGYPAEIEAAPEPDVEYE